MSLQAVSENATSTHEKQQKMVVGHSEAKPDIPGDYTMSPGSVPSLPGGIEKFEMKSGEKDMNTMGYLSLLTGIACLFMASIRLSLSLPSTS
jgi:hypothetical protein